MTVNGPDEIRIGSNYPPSGARSNNQANLSDEYFRAQLVELEGRRRGLRPTSNQDSFNSNGNNIQNAQEEKRLSNMIDKLRKIVELREMLGLSPEGQNQNSTRTT